MSFPVFPLHFNSVPQWLVFYGIVKMFIKLFVFIVMRNRFKRPVKFNKYLRSSFVCNVVCYVSWYTVWLYVEFNSHKNNSAHEFEYLWVFVIFIKKMYTKNRLKIIINAINIPTHHTTLFIRIYKKWAVMDACGDG